MPDVPYYYKSVDWERLVEEYQPAPAFMDGVFTWPRERIRELQFERLQRQVEEAWEVPFYRQHWKESGFHPDDLKSLEDLRRIPTYTVEDIRDSIDRQPPMGDYQGVRWPDDLGEMPLRVFFSGGTTGRSRPTLYTPWDREVGAILTARCYWMQGLRPGDIVVNNFAFSLHNAAWIIDHALWDWMGCLPITASTGNVTSTDRQIEIARQYDVDAFISFGDYLLHMAERAQDMGLDPKEDFDFKCFPAIGSAEAVEKTWGVPTYDSYGFHEVQYVAGESEAKAGLHIFEDAFIIEVVDVETEEPMSDGEVGDLVITCLYKTGSPQIRYNIKDLSRILPGDDPLGSGMRRMDHFMGRSDTMVKLRGINVWPEAVGDIVTDDERTTSEYFVVVEREGHRDEMTCMVEARPGADVGELRRSLEERLKSKLGVRVNVHPAEMGELDSITGKGKEPKMKRFEDRRNPL